MFAAFENLTGFLWGIPLLGVILITGIYFTVKTGFFQFKHFGYIVTNMFKKERRTGVEAEKTRLTPFQAISIAVGGSVGVSNMSGVATAIATGGPGALFWLWVAALFGMIIKMAEVSLAVYYRESTDDGQLRGGPTYYIEKALGVEKGFKGWKLLALIFGGGIFMTWFVTLQNYTVAEAVGTTFNLPLIVPAGIYVVLVYVIIAGGIKKVGVFAQYLTPIMCGFYILAAIYILIMDASALPNTFKLIFQGAFTPMAATGGFAGASVAYAMRLGFARSVYSNEAGWGTSPMVHAAANTDHPIKQGLMGAFEVFADTMLVCTMTGLVVITTGYWNSGLQGATLTLTAFESVLGTNARIVIALSIFLFGLTTTTGWYTYYRVLIEHAFKNSPGILKIVRPIVIIGTPIWGFLITIVTAYGNGTPAQVWVLADFSSVIPTFVNVAILFVIGNKFIELLKDYKARYMGIGNVDPNMILFYEDELKFKKK